MYGYRRWNIYDDMIGPGPDDPFWDEHSHRGLLSAIALSAAALSVVWLWRHKHGLHGSAVGASSALV